MEIRSKKQLKFYIMADRIMNGLSAKPTIKEKILDFAVSRPPIMKYLKYVRELSYWRHQTGIIAKLMTGWKYRRCNQLSVKLGCFISEDVFRYGLVVPHHGTLRVGNKNRVGRYAVIHTLVNMTASQVEAGDGLYLSVGCKVIGPLSLGNNITVAANSVVHKSVDGDNLLLAGMPASVKRENYGAWYIRDGIRFQENVQKVENLRVKMGLPEDI